MNLDEFFKKVRSTGVGRNKYSTTILEIFKLIIDELPKRPNTIETHKYLIEEINKKTIAVLKEN